MPTSRIWTGIFSDFFINLAAGWFGAVLILPAFSKIFESVNFGVLILNIVAGIVSLLASFQLRKSYIK